MSTLRTGWGIELLAVFICGFLVATMLWLGLWFFWTRPGKAAAVQATEATLREKETALLNCVAARDRCNELKDKLQAENNQLDVKLKEALIGWGRCIRSKGAPEAQESPKPSAP